MAPDRQTDGQTDGQRQKNIPPPMAGYNRTFEKSTLKKINILTKFHKDWMKTVTSNTNILTKFHEDWMKTVTSIVYTSDLINILTKFHKDWMKTVTSTVYTNKLLTDARTHSTHSQWTPDITRSQKLTMSLGDR
ncbi:hypothetical protein DPMN_014709 [Dreissena polymorpha]|uniref:Uncharacterized protein n=1 Tax=Dreissena polymorpha TaxID=45954 RepID=A0A9D4S2Z0_DREPO|nr:hypothetical protein DPMN_014709 [Dreissena polymorpha]